MIISRFSGFLSLTAVLAVDSDCSNVNTTALSSNFEFMIKCAANDSSTTFLADCAGYNQTSIFAYSQRSGFNTSCLGAFSNFYGSVKNVCLDPCISGENVTIFNTDCMTLLLSPLENFTTTLDNGYDLVTGVESHRCDPAALENLDLLYSPFPAMCAVGFANSSYGEHMLDLNRLIDLHYTNRTDLSFLGAVLELPCYDCFSQFMNSTGHVANSCSVNNEQVDGCHIAQSVAIGGNHYFPHCPVCQTALDEYIAMFMFCAGAALRTTYVEPIAMNLFNITSYPHCVDSMRNSSYYPFAKCAVMFPNPDGSDALTCLQNDMIAGPDFRVTSCSDPWKNFSIALSASVGFNESCPDDGLTSSECESFFNNSQGVLGSLRSDIGSNDFNLSSVSPYICATQEESDAVWGYAGGRGGILRAAMNSSSLFDIVNKIGLVPNVSHPCVQCVADAAVTLYATNTAWNCSQNLTESICPDLEHYLTEVYPQCSGQSFSLKTDACVVDDPQADWMNIPPDQLFLFMLELAIFPDFPTRLYLEVINTTCYDCFLEFAFVVAARVMYETTLYLGCVVDDQFALYADTCIETFGTDFARFEDCHGAFSMYTCPDEQWANLTRADFAGAISAQLALNQTAPDAFDAVRAAMASQIDINTYGCVWCAQDLLNSMWPLRDQLSTECVPDISAGGCVDLLAPSLAVFHTCANQTLVGLLAPPTTTTTTTSATTTTTRASVPMKTAGRLLYIGVALTILCNL